MDTGTSKKPILRSALPKLTFVLTQLDVYNWGSFSGRHTAQFDLEGTAIIGPTGSGKSTLVDALMTLLTANPRYNLASTGGHQSDRELVSYIRGVSGAGNRSGDNELIARAGKTVSGISARFSNGDEHLTIGALFSLDGTSSALADLKRSWIFSQSPEHSLEQWLTTHHEGGARALKQLARETPGLQIYDTKNTYLAQVRRFFEVGENAFSLLTRAAGLKQIDSIDEIFRELVLEDTSAIAPGTADLVRDSRPSPLDDPSCRAGRKHQPMRLARSGTGATHPRRLRPGGEPTRYLPAHRRRQCGATARTHRGAPTNRQGPNALRARLSEACTATRNRHHPDARVTTGKPHACETQAQETRPNTQKKEQSRLRCRRR